MNSVQIEENVKALVQNISNQSLSRNEFVYELLLAYGHRKSVVSRVKSGERNLSKTDGEVILKRHLYFKPCQTNLFAEVDEIKRSKAVETNKIRFVVVTDFNQIIAIDTKTQDTLDIELNQLPKHFDFFLPWAGMEKMVYRGENPADVKAAEKMADFFDHIKEQNYPANAPKEQLHELVVFLNRLLFCFFAEDTKIFGENQFTNLLNQHTSEDGSNVNSTLERLFEVLNKPAHQRGDLPQYLASFPYVNGGLFKKDIVIPSFDAKARRMLLDSGQLDWADINPDIFGSMIQGVADPETRSKMGMHYTSVTNIMKVIEPLFLNDFYDEFEKCKDNISKLRKLQVRLSRIKIFDPACGSGNFLIIAYREVRLLEIEILKRIRELEGESDSGAMGLFDESHSSIRLDQFYGIELDDFAHEMAILSLWLVEHQMNMVFETEFGYTAPTLPLKQSGRIVAGNATRIDWELVCPSSGSDEIYLLGNPPYLGSNYQTSTQKDDLQVCFDHVSGIKNLDYVSCWLIKASSFISNKECYAAFVTTNSICQGEQVDMLWPKVFTKGISISFCYQSFKWTNSAKNNAGVTCVIIGLSNKAKVKNLIYRENLVEKVKSISPYLIEGSNLTIKKRRKPISQLKPMVFGSKPVDGGNLILTDDEKDSLLESYPEARTLIKKLLGADEFIKGYCRWCIWITDENLALARSIAPINERIQKTKEFRLNSKKIATQKSALTSHKFGEIRHAETNSIIIPRVSSEKREYLLSGFLEPDAVILDRAQAIPDATLYEFGIISSKMHMAWTNAVTGRLETRLNYSSSLCYNNFPIPKVLAHAKAQVEEKAMELLEVRERFPELNYAQLYDPKTMPTELRSAHEALDLVVDSLYSNKAFESDSDRLVLLFKLYETMQG
ncbi:DNA methyltransferase [Vibrio parahaemolyticus]|uniref:DNA methyltransferase n=1 Tax=Vibrio parahaemolyticus TaxID=670 RepID=UPI00084AA9A0|nr:DNA methyltransferase [Vibrio parahaemolyticus]OEB32263.1 DNA methyltransferase [Vibrio parahaemolyticus]HCG9599759.1 class I SAM-dependent DNA methyltransferase [Vibrio parahaemolyticus]HCH0109545.1 class I SAM-dependent DNA methyltransferase [Vibrio parahaemolyticus]HCH0124835.1 class I SAM-dependent DNA methyltransferase [Vibrio parahaemolyticus]HCH0228595.1 class I SAM-dependent DNA methyltransferase [Vibrio parahaemolyticus]